MHLGAAPTEVMAVQTGRDTVRISWTAPIVPPGNGYRITTNRSSDFVDVLSSPHTIIIPAPGVYRIGVKSNSQHLRGVPAEITFVMIGEH